MKRSAVIQWITERQQSFYLAGFILVFALIGQGFAEPLPRRKPSSEKFLIQVSYYKEIPFTVVNPIRKYKTTTYFTTTIDSVGILMNSSPFPEKAVVTIIKVK